MAVTFEDCCISASAPHSEIIALLKLHGFIVVKGLLSPEAAAEVKAELQPGLDAQAPKEGDALWDGSFFPSTTRHTAGALVKSPAFVKSLVLNDTIYEIAKDTLSKRTKLRLMTPKKWATSLPHISTCGALELHPGTPAQPIHRDDTLWHVDQPAADVWTRGRDATITTLTALSPCFPENGATLFIPGSHLWDEYRDPTYEECLSGIMDVGDTAIFLGRTMHAGGHNATKDSVRTLAVFTYCSGFLRTEENQFLVMKSDPEATAQLPRRALELAGYDISLPFT
ncbi:hypothetical protein P7C70_g1962, partial [Phenoliferia sp. Uapishka_3]